jgi:hypothetical protein
MTNAKNRAGPDGRSLSRECEGKNEQKAHKEGDRVLLEKVGGWKERRGARLLHGPLSGSLGAA